MSYQNMTREQYDQLVQSMGPEEVAKLVATFGTQVDGMPAPQAQPLAVRPPAYQSVADLRQMTPPQAPAMPPQTQGPTTMGALPSPDTAESLQAAIMARPQAMRQAAKDRLAQGQMDVAKMYGGPDTSQMLFALSQALLAPRQFGGFGGTMYNVSQALGQIGEQQQNSAQQREAALAKLRSTYATDTATADDSALDSRLKLYGMRKEAEAEAAKAAAPKYDIDPLTGRYMMRPGTGTHLGMLTPEQFAAAKADPANRGKRFIGADGIEREIP